jgi:hypothetical protein
VQVHGRLQLRLQRPDGPQFGGFPGFWSRPSGGASR